MATKTIAWNTGSGNITVDYGGSGDGQITITTDSNSLYEARSQQITVRTTDGSDIQRTITIQQAAKVRIDISTAVVTASNQTYNGSAKTPTPTVTLNGVTVPSTGYDVAYSNNTNAGTATVTVTGKNDYTGTAIGTFTIAKASRTLSFADSYVVLNTSSNVTKTATPSAGSGDGAITYSISSTTYATINSSSGKVTAKTSDGSAVVTATIAEGTNYLSAIASYNLYVFATTHDYSYSGSYSSVTLPPGTYQLQCWGAQGGSNAAASSYSITAKAGGKGGYSVGQLTVSEATGVRVYVGGQGSSSAGGYNGGGSTSGSSTYDNSNTYGTSRMGGGGGATDIRLSDGSLYSRMIVAGGGSGGAMCYKSSTSTTWQNIGTINLSASSGTFNGYSWTRGMHTNGTTRYYQFDFEFGESPLTDRLSTKHTFSGTPSGFQHVTYWTDVVGAATAPPGPYSQTASNPVTFTYNNYSYYQGNTFKYRIQVHTYNNTDLTGTLTIAQQVSSTSTSNDSQAGYVGGGTNGGGYSSSYYGKQNGAGSNGAFGTGAAMSTTNYRYCSGAGGGGWYGGGSAYSDSTMSYVRHMGGGSGWVNTAASAGNRPSGYTGLQLDSGTTYAGGTSFPAPGGGNETGHAGNGYARITRIS